jgi:DNA polymerase III alpha subunit
MPDQETHRARLLDIDEVMGRLGIGRSTVFGLLSSGEVERSLTGSWITADPTAPYAADITKWCVNSPAEIELRDPGAEFWLGGEVGACRGVTDRRGRPMGFLTVLWNSHEFEVAVFSDEWLQHGNRLIEGMPVICKARKDDRGRCHLIELANANYFTTGTR